jgi:hypothetical protein
MAVGGRVRDRDLRVVATAIGISALGDGVALVAGAIGARESLWLAGGLSALVGVAGLAVLAGRRGGARHDVAASAAETA